MAGLIPADTTNASDWLPAPPHVPHNHGTDCDTVADGIINHDEMAHTLGPLEWRVHDFDSIETLLPIRETWNRLASQTAGATHFLTFDWLATYWKYNSANQKLRILVVTTEKMPESRADNRKHDFKKCLGWEKMSDRQGLFVTGTTIIGIMPLVVREEETRAGKVRVLTFPLHGWGSFYTPLGPCVDQTLYKSLEYLSKQKRDYDLLDLRWIDNRLGLGDVAAVAMRAQKFSVRADIWNSTAQVDLSDGWDTYWASRSSHWRTNVRSNQKKLQRAGRVEYIRHRPSSENYDPRWDLYEACETLALKSWQGDRDDGTTLSHPEVKEYLRAAHETAVQCGAADINLLLVDHQPVAFAYNYAQFGSVYGLRAGYDQDWKRCGVGSILMHEMLHDSAARGDRLFDLGTGNVPSKEPWLTSIVPTYRYTNYSPWSWKAWILRAKHSLKKTKDD